MMDEWLDLGELVDRVQNLIDVGLFDEAGQLLDAYREVYTGAWELSYLYSRISSTTNRHAEAITHLRDCLRQGGHTADCYLNLFYEHTQLGQLGRGARYLLRAKKKSPNNDQVLSALIWYYGETNRFEKGLAAFERARSLGVENPDVFRNAGLLYQRLGLHREAADCFKKALELAPESDELHDLLADFYVLSNEAGRAVELYQRYLKKSPNNVRVLSRLVFCLAQKGDIDKATRVARRTTRLYPNSPIGYVDLAYVLLSGSNPDGALEQVDRALTVAPLESEAYRVKGLALSEKNRDADADEAFRKAMSLDPENSEILRDYYHHLWKVGDYTRMEQVVAAVIRREKPHCIEDYWFLADHYWEGGHASKAFRCLNKAHKSMPGERELLPPLITIMVNRGHTSYAMPYLIGYANSAGWNETIRALTRHRRLRGKAARESMRFVRFNAERTGWYRLHAYNESMHRWLTYTPLVLFVPLGGVLLLTAGVQGMAAGAIPCGLAFITMKLSRFLADAPPLLFRRFLREHESGT
jgi:tetratricopeptide (TPR) repeat protein